MFLRWNSTGLVLVLFAVLLVACGGDDGSSVGGKKTDFEAVSLYPSSILTAGVETRLSGYGLEGITASINGTALVPTLQNAHELDFITPDLPVGEYTIDITNDSGMQQFPVSVKPRFDAISVSAGGYFTCAVRQDGTVWCWGKNYVGQLGSSITLDEEWLDYHNTPVQIPGIENAVSVESGREFACALLQDHSVKCWSDNSSGQLGNQTTTSSALPVSVYGINEAISISVGDLHACALLSDQSIKCWGANAAGQLGNGIVLEFGAWPYVNEPVLVEGIGSAVVVDAGMYFTCAVLSDKTVKCWGDNFFGQLGNASHVDSSSAVDVNGIAAAIDVSAGASHACAVLEDNTVKCWGNNEKGALGDGTENDSVIPVTVTGIDSAVNVYVGVHVSCAILADKTARCWGANDYGYFGVESIGFSLEPVMAMPDLTEITAISFSYQHVCALQADAGLYCWGNGQVGQLGNSLNNSMTAPVTLKGKTAVKGLALWNEYGRDSADTEQMQLCLLKNDGTVECRGQQLLPYNNYGVKYYSPFMAPEFSAMEGVNTAVKVIAGHYLPCVLLENGEIACRDWDDSLYKLSGISNAVDIFQGRQTDGLALLGDGSLVYLNSNPPLPSRWGNKVKMVSAGDDHSCLVLTDKTVGCTGANGYGQLGSHLMGGWGSPVQVEGVSSAISVAVTESTSCALLENKRVVCWGSNEWGQLGRNISGEYTYDPASVWGLYNVTSIAAGSDHFCAIKTDQSVWCWGSNRNGQLGNPLVGSSSVKPVRVAGINNAASIVASDQSACAVLDDGYAQCWGAMMDLYKWETPAIPVYMP